MSKLNNKKGFTLIEIVIVLAIAALVLAAVLLAVSGAQKARRDTQRKNDAGSYAAALEQYASNTSGDYPATGVALASTYFDRKDPGSGSVYAVVSAAPSVGQIQYVLGVDCAAAASGRYYALTVGLEQGGSACFSNHK